MVSKPSHRIGLIFWILMVVNLGAAAALFGAYAAYYLDPGKYFLFALLGLLYPWILLANLLFILLWLMLWRSFVWISLVSVLIGWQQLTALVAWHPGNDVQPPGGILQVMTYNVHGFYGSANASGSFRKEITAFIGSEHPDILCMQEFHLHGEAYPSMIRQMEREWQLPYSRVTNYLAGRDGPGVNGLALFSRYPVIGLVPLEYEEGRRYGQVADIVFGMDTIRVVNAHLASLHLNQEDVNFYYQLKQQYNGSADVRKGLFSIMRKLKKAFTTRSVQVRHLQQVISQSRYPVILCGDLNDSPFSYTYKKISNILTDSYREAGNSLTGFTYDGALPNYRIDYLFHDEAFQTYSYERVSVRFSDHYPIKAAMAIEHLNQGR